MLSLDEYKKVQGARLAHMTEEEILKCFECESFFVAFAIKRWLASRATRKPECGKMPDTSCQTPLGQ